MLPLIGGFIESFQDLVIDIFKIGKLPERPEVVTQVFYATLHFSFFVGRPDIAGHRRYAEVALIIALNGSNFEVRPGLELFLISGCFKYLLTVPLSIDRVAAICLMENPISFNR